MTRPAITSDLFDAARRGEQTAIARLLDIAQPDIRRYARAACRSATDAEDAAQEALWLLYRRVGAIRSLAAISSWLFTVIRRECLRLARRAGRFAAPADEADQTERIAAAKSDLDVQLDVVAAIEALPPQYRDMILMRDVKEMTISEIAVALDATNLSVKARLHRARRLMRDYLTR